MALKGLVCFYISSQHILCPMKSTFILFIVERFNIVIQNMSTQNMSFVEPVEHISCIMSCLIKT